MVIVIVIVIAIYVWGDKLNIGGNERVPEKRTTVTPRPQYKLGVKIPRLFFTSRMTQNTRESNAPSREHPESLVFDSIPESPTSSVFLPHPYTRASVQGQGKNTETFLHLENHSESMGIECSQ